MYRKCIILYVNFKGGKLTVRVAHVPLRTNLSTVKHPFQLILFIKTILYTCIVEIGKKYRSFVIASIKNFPYRFINMKIKMPKVVIKNTLFV